LFLSAIPIRFVGSPVFLFFSIRLAFFSPLHPKFSKEIKNSQKRKRKHIKKKNKTKEDENFIVGAASVLAFIYSLYYTRGFSQIVTLW